MSSSTCCISWVNEHVKIGEWARVEHTEQLAPNQLIDDRAARRRPENRFQVPVVCRPHCFVLLPFDEAISIVNCPWNIQFPSTSIVSTHSRFRKSGQVEKLLVSGSTNEDL